jgi:hypothetical protein
MKDQIDHFALAEMEVRGSLKRSSHFAAVSQSVGLSARGLDSRTAGTIQQSKLDSSAINYASHDSTERIDLSHNMALRDTTNGWVTRHLSYQIQIERHQGGFAAETGRSRGCFATSMAPSDNDHVKNFSEGHFYFPIQNVEKICARI